MFHAKHAATIRMLVFAGLACIASNGLPITATAVEYHYVAKTKQKSMGQGSVRAGTIEWACKGRTCKVSGPWPIPGVSACSQLARQIGEIESYGHPKKSLGAAEINRCNASARRAAPVAKKADAPKGVMRAPTTAVRAPAPVIRSDAAEKLRRATEPAPSETLRKAALPKGRTLKPGLSSPAVRSVRDAGTDQAAKQASRIRGPALQIQPDPEERESPDSGPPRDDIDLVWMQTRGTSPTIRFSIDILTADSSRWWTNGGFVDVVLYEGTPDSGLRRIDDVGISIPPVDPEDGVRIEQSFSRRTQARDNVWYTLRARFRNVPQDSDPSNNCFEYRWFTPSSDGARGSAPGADAGRFDCSRPLL